MDGPITGASITFDEMWYTKRNALTFTLTHRETNNTSKIRDKICTTAVWLTITHEEWRQQFPFMGHPLYVFGK